MDIEMSEPFFPDLGPVINKALELIAPCYPDFVPSDVEPPFIVYGLTGGLGPDQYMDGQIGNLCHQSFAVSCVGNSLSEASDLMKRIRAELYKVQEGQMTLRSFDYTFHDLKGARDLRGIRNEFECFIKSVDFVS